MCIICLSFLRSLMLLYYHRTKETDSSWVTHWQFLSCSGAGAGLIPRVDTGSSLIFDHCVSLTASSHVSAVSVWIIAFQTVSSSKWSSLVRKQGLLLPDAGVMVVAFIFILFSVPDFHTISSLTSMWEVTGHLHAFPLSRKPVAAQLPVASMSYHETFSSIYDEEILVTIYV